MSEKAVVLFSGGMDSTVTAMVAQRNGYDVIGLNVIYGQKHDVEISAAQAVAEEIGIQLVHYRLNLDKLVKSALVRGGDEIPLDRDLDTLVGVAPTYVPARNSIFLALAAGFADSYDNVRKIFIGVHRENHVNYPDCRPEFIEAMNKALNLGTKNGVAIEAPFANKTKTDIVKVGHALDAPFELTHSCYQGKRPACGVCDTCKIRIQAFKEAGLVDPLEYEIDIDWGVK